MHQRSHLDSHLLRVTSHAIIAKHKQKGQAEKEK